MYPTSLLATTTATNFLKEVCNDDPILRIKFIEAYKAEKEAQINRLLNPQLTTRITRQQTSEIFVGNKNSSNKTVDIARNPTFFRCLPLNKRSKNVGTYSKRFVPYRL